MYACAERELTRSVHASASQAGNELFVGRMAMIGFAASLLGETLTGMGALAHMDLTTCLDLSGVEEFKEDHPGCEVHDPIISFNTAGSYSNGR